MIFIFIEDGTLEILASPEQARQKCEGIDVENGAFKFFDEDGTYLEPRFTRPNKAQRFLGIISWVESGEFELVRVPDSEEDIFIRLSKTVELEPNQWFNDLDEVRRFLQDH